MAKTAPIRVRTYPEMTAEQRRVAAIGQMIAANMGGVKMETSHVISFINMAMEAAGPNGMAFVTKADLDQVETDIKNQLETRKRESSQGTLFPEGDGSEIGAEGTSDKLEESDGTPKAPTPNEPKKGSFPASGARRTAAQAKAAEALGGSVDTDVSSPKYAEENGTPGGEAA